MKTLASFIAGFLLFAFSLHASAQTSPPKDYFPGKWNVLVEGTPQADGKMTVTLERKEGKLGGTIITKAGGETTKIDKVEEKEKSVTLYFNTNGYDVNLTMEKKDDDHVTGNVMGMFDAKGERAKEASLK